MTAYWLVKSEPAAFSWDQQVANGIEPWTGVRNHTAKNNLKAMKKGDLAFFYHSNIGKEIVGIVEVVREAYPDPTAGSGGWICVDMKAVKPVPKPVALAAIKAEAELAEDSADPAVTALRNPHLAVPLGEALLHGWPIMSRLCALADIPDIGAIGSPATQGRLCELVIVRKGANVYVYENACPHIGTPLDWVPNKFLSRDGRYLICATHGAQFTIETGECISGPCRGDYLTPLNAEVRDGIVYLPESA